MGVRGGRGGGEEGKGGGDGGKVASCWGNRESGSWTIEEGEREGWA